MQTQKNKKNIRHHTMILNRNTEKQKNNLVQKTQKEDDREEAKSIKPSIELMERRG